MSFEEFDKRIRDAADHHHPAYDEKAWNKMEKLLNKHLPLEEDKRRRFLFLILLFLLTGGGLAVFIAQPWKQKSPVAAVDTPNKTSDKPVSNPASTENSLLKTTESTLPGEDQTSAESRKSIEPVLAEKKTRAIIFFEPKNNYTKPIAEKTDISLVTEKKETKTPDLTEINTKQIAKETLASDNKLVAKETILDPSLQHKDVTKTSNENKPIIVSEEKQTETTKAENKTKAKNNKKNSFFFSLSGGADISGTKISDAGKIKLLGGVGLGYTFKDRLTVRTGFYTGRKVYSADPYDYHPPAIFWAYYPNLNKVDADCKVYEIPLHLSYNFGSSSKQNWFAGAGVSSYLMKTETYTYYYKDNSGQPATRKWTIKDENNHYFSVLTFSGGYQRKINKTFSIMAEPYVKIPLIGVGYGKVKLNSAGVLLSATIKPFGKK